MAGDCAGGAVGGDLAKKLQAHDGEEEEEDKHENVRQGVEAWNKGPDKKTDADALA